MQLHTPRRRDQTRHDECKRNYIRICAVPGPALLAAAREVHDSGITPAGPTERPVLFPRRAAQCYRRSAAHGTDTAYNCKVVIHASEARAGRAALPVLASNDGQACRRPGAETRSLIGARRRPIALGQNCCYHFGGIDDSDGRQM